MRRSWLFQLAFSKLFLPTFTQVQAAGRSVNLYCKLGLETTYQALFMSCYSLFSLLHTRYNSWNYTHSVHRYLQTQTPFFLIADFPFFFKHGTIITFLVDSSIFLSPLCVQSLFHVLFTSLFLARLSDIFVCFICLVISLLSLCASSRACFSLP